MSIWKKTGEYTSVTDVILKKTGKTSNELQHPLPMNPYQIENMDSMVRVVSEAIKTEKPFVIVGDYDADGITSVAILVKLLGYFGVNPTVIIPKRFTDGYGVSEKLINNIKNSLIITVDNGISSHVAINTARKNKNEIVILDHHLPEAELPLADVIVDPYVNPNSNKYTNFCGAGLAYEFGMAILTKERISNIKTLINDITVLACIGTLADVIPLLDESRRIVIEGLKIINDKTETLSAGIRSILNLAEYPISEESITFKIAPTINATGRLYDAGGMSVLKTLCLTDKRQSYENSLKMNDINERRKSLVNTYYPLIEKEIKQQIDKNILVIYVPMIPEGIVGILTGKVAEIYQRPAFIFTTTNKDETLLKSSGRSYGEYDLYKTVLLVKDLCLTAGGHQGAAGISCLKTSFKTIQEKMWASCEDIILEQEKTLYYDIEIEPDQVEETLLEIKRYIPFGQGNPKPRFVIKNFVSKARYNSFYNFMGKSKEHIKLNGDTYSAVGFNLASKFIENGCKTDLDLLGTIGENTFNGQTSAQFMIEDFK